MIVLLQDPEVSTANFIWGSYGGEEGRAELLPQAPIAWGFLQLGRGKKQSQKESEKESEREIRASAPASCKACADLLGAWLLLLLLLCGWIW